MDKKYLTTFQAAELMSVTPDSVLKWIKSGKLAARRTPGGHYRIERNSIKTLFKETGNPVSHESILKHRVFQYCWEFNEKRNNCQDNCEDCMVFKVRALRCYKLSKLPFASLGLFCKSSCEECEYYKLVEADN